MKVKVSGDFGSSSTQRQAVGALVGESANQVFLILSHRLLDQYEMKDEIKCNRKEERKTEDN